MYKVNRFLGSFLLAIFVTLGIVTVSVAQTDEVQIIPFRFYPFVEAGKPFSISWMILGEGDVTHTDVHWRLVSCEDLTEVFEKVFGKRGTLLEDEDYLDELSFNKGKEFTERMRIYRDDTLVVPEPSGDEVPVIELVIHAVVDGGKNFYLPMIVRIMPAGFSSPPGDLQQPQTLSREGESDNSWTYTSPVWAEADGVEISRRRWGDNPFSDWDGYCEQYQWWHPLNMDPDASPRYPPPGGVWANTSYSYRMRFGDPSEGMPIIWEDEWYYFPSSWSGSGYVFEFNGTHRLEKLPEGWILVEELHHHVKPRSGFAIPSDLMVNGKKGKLFKKVIFDNVNNAYDDNISYYKLNGVAPDPEDSHLENGVGRLVFNLGGYLKVGDVLEVELTITGPFKHETEVEIWGDLKSTWERDYRQIRFSTPRLAEVDLKVTDIKAIQVIEDVPLIKDKETMVRVFVSLEGDLDEVEDVKVELDFNGIKYTSQSQTVKKNYTKRERYHAKDSFNFYVPAPTTVVPISANATVDPDNEIPEKRDDNNTPPEAKTLSVEEPEKGLRYMYLPIGVETWEEATIIPTSPTGIPCNEFLVGVYPLAKSQVTPIYDDTVLQVSIPWVFCAHWRTKATYVLSQLIKLQKSFPNIDHIVGVFPTGWLPSKVLGMSREGYKGGELVLNRAPDYIAAHEILHTYGYGHTLDPRGGPEYGPHQYGKIAEDGWWVIKKGHRISAAPLIYDGTGDGLIYNFYSFMRPRWCVPESIVTIRTWCAPDDYANLINELVRSEGSKTQGGVARSVSPLLLAIGMILADHTVQLIPWQFVEEGVPTPSTIGEYSMECVSSDGTVLNRVTFDPCRSAEPTEEEVYLFCLTIEFPADTCKIVIKHHDTVLKEVAVSPSAPTVTVTSPNGGEQWDGIQKITWEGNDADGNKLYYTILYSHNGGGDWIPLGADLTTTVYFLNTTSLPGGTDCLIKVLATDGVRSSHDMSDAVFSIPVKGPEAYISLPIEGAKYKKGSTVTLNGVGIDQDGSELDNSSLAWFSNMDGFIEIGGHVSTSTLSLGDHEITLEVSDDENQKESAEVNISVATDTSPDLSIHEIAFIPEIPSIEDTSIIISANILNVITDAFCDVSFYVDGDSIYTQEIAAFANSLSEVRAGWTPPGPGIYDISVVISNAEPVESDTSNNEAHREFQVMVDTTPPTTTDNYQYNEIWTNQNADITLTATNGESGVANTYYTIDGIQHEGTAISITEEGKHTVTYWSVDNAGNEEPPHTIGVWIDKTPPTVTADITPTPNEKGWNNSDVIVVFTAQDQEGLSGVEKVDPVAVITAEGKHQVTGRGWDNAGNQGSITISISIDKTAPVTTGTVSPSPNEAGWINRLPVSVTFTATDNLSGAKTTTPDVEIIEEGTHNIAYQSTDNAGNVEEAKTVVVKVDTTPPVTTAKVTPAPNAAGWHNTLPVKVSFSATDNLSGVKTTTPDVEITEEGIHNLAYQSTDNAGNVEVEKTITVRVDTTTPTTTDDYQFNETWTNKDANIALTATDAQSGVANTYYTIDGTQYEGNTISISAEGKHTVTYWSTDNADNGESAHSIGVWIDKSPPEITIHSPKAITYYNTKGPVDINIVVSDTYDPSPSTKVTLDGGPAADPIDITALAFGPHILEVEATDVSKNKGEATVTFEVQPEPLASFQIKKLEIDWKKESKKPKMDKIKIDGRLDLPAGYTASDLDPEVTVMVEVGGSSGTDEVLAKAKKHDWKYKRKKHEIPAGTNMDIKKLKIKWDKKDKKPDKFKLDGELDVVNDGSGIVTVTLLIPVTAGGDLGESETVTCKIKKHHWEYRLK